MTDMIMTMMTNVAIPAAEYTYGNKVSVLSGAVVLTARKTGFSQFGFNKATTTHII